MCVCVCVCVWCVGVCVLGVVGAKKKKGKKVIRIKRLRLFRQ